MSLILRRPYLIEESCCTTKLPSPSLGMDLKRPDVPSPVVEQLFQYRTSQLTIEINALQNDTDISTITRILEKVRDLYQNLPPTLRFWSSPPSFDEQYPHVVYARHKVLLGAYSVAFMLLKRFILTKDLTTACSSDDESAISQYRIAACEFGIRIIELTAHMEAQFNPERGKDHQVCFYPFDTAITFCVALQKDPERSLPKRDQIYAAIRQAVSTLSRLLDSKIAREGHKILLGMLDSISLPPTGNHPPEANRFQTPHEVFPMCEASTEAAEGEIEQPKEESPLQDVNLDLFTMPADPEWKDAIDLGALDDIFHWDSIYPVDLSVPQSSLDVLPELPLDTFAG
jgi:hypothetical protein